MASKVYSQHQPVYNTLKLNKKYSQSILEKKKNVKLRNKNYNCAKLFLCVEEY